MDAYIHLKRHPYRVKLLSLPKWGFSMRLKIISSILLIAVVLLGACVSPSTPPVIQKSAPTTLTTPSTPNTPVTPTQPQSQPPKPTTFPKSYQLNVPHIYAGLEGKPGSL